MLYYLTVLVFKICFFIVFSTHITGKKNVPKGVPLIVCSNHVGFLDPILIAVTCRRPVYFIAKKELFESFFTGIVMKLLRAFPVDRESGKDIKAMKKAMSLLKERKTLGIFFQGTRMKELDSKNAKAGVSMFAIKAKAPVVPVAIKTDYKFFSKVYIEYGEPITFDQYYDKRITQEVLAEATDTITKKISALVDKQGVKS